jgi:hypothetical protein
VVGASPKASSSASVAAPRRTSVRLRVSVGKCSKVAGTTGRYTGSYLDQRCGWRAVAILAANRCVENSLFKRANGFYYETEKVFHTGRRMNVTEYALPDVGAQRLSLQNRMPEVYREQKDVKHQLSMDEAFLRFLDQMDEQAKLERARNARMIEHQPVINEMLTGNDLSMQTTCSSQLEELVAEVVEVSEG